MRSIGTPCPLTVAIYMLDEVHVGYRLVDVRFLHVFFLFDGVRIYLFDFLVLNDDLLVSHRLTTLSKILYNKVYATAPVDIIHPIPKENR